MKDAAQPSPLPFSFPFDLGTLGDKDVHIRLAPDSQARNAIAGWLEVNAVSGFTAEITLSRAGALYRYEASFAVDLVQACVVTLEPVPSHLEGRVQREFRLPPRRPSKRPQKEMQGDPIDLDLSGSEDGPETLDSSIVNLAGPVLEEVSLALDPYPRAPGAAFPAGEAADDADAAVSNPFAVLEKLKNPGA